MNELLVFFLCIIGCEAVGIISAIPTAKSVRTWYKKLKKPSFNPPSAVFGPMWTILYALMGISLSLVLLSPHAYSQALWLFGLQLLCNFVWSFLFFGFKKLFLSLVEIVILLLLIIYTLFSFWQISSLASILLIPYFLWVSFATILNAAIWKLNRKDS